MRFLSLRPGIDGNRFRIWKRTTVRSWSIQSAIELPPSKSRVYARDLCSDTCRLMCRENGRTQLVSGRIQLSNRAG
jgi:hypothetical protein